MNQDNCRVKAEAKCHVLATLVQYFVRHSSWCFGQSGCVGGRECHAVNYLGISLTCTANFYTSSALLENTQDLFSRFLRCLGYGGRIAPTIVAFPNEQVGVRPTLILSDSSGGLLS
jgi:hypothetical protein